MPLEHAYDSETTGLYPNNGDRICELALIELDADRRPTGRTFHRYINPQRAMSPEAVAIHGLTDAFLADKPLFGDIVDELLDYLGDGRLVIHNADFDLQFLNGELRRLQRRMINPFHTSCTLTTARRIFPGADNSLDGLCKRLAIDTSHRTKHGAMLDAELLVQVYQGLDAAQRAARGPASQAPDLTGARPTGPVRPARTFTASPDELAAHRAMIATELTDPLWLRFLGAETTDTAAASSPMG